jgi:hypothetical protein
MLNRLDDTKKLVSQTTVTQNRDNEIVKQIKDKFVGTFDEYAYVEHAERIKKGDIIRYVDLGLTKVSLPGIVIDTVYEEHILSKSLKYITLLNTIKRTYWKIIPKKVYIFRSYKLGKMSKVHSKKFIDSLNFGDSLIDELHKNIDDYKDRYDKGLLG